MASQDFVYRGHLYIGGGPKGFSERYTLKGTDPAACLITFNKLCQWRRTILGDDFQILWARVSKSGSPPDGRAAIDAPLPAFGDGSAPVKALGYDVVNVTADSLLFRYETIDGKWGMRMVRAIPDPKVVDEFFTNSPLTMLATAPTTIGTVADSWLDNLLGFLAFVRDNTYRAKAPSGVVTQWTVDDWVKVMYRRVATHKTGRPFGQSAGRAS